jgi:hypothetical protein
MNQSIKDPFLKHWLVWTGLVLVLGLQVLAAIIYVFSFIPIVLKDPSTHQPYQPPPGLEPEREIFFYGIYIVSTVLVFLAGLLFFRDRIEKPGWLKNASILLVVESGWLALMAFAAFKLLVYRYPFYNFVPIDNGRWVAPLLWCIALSSLSSKIFWPELLQFIKKMGEQQRVYTSSIRLHWAAWSAFAALIFIMLYRPSVPHITPALFFYLIVYCLLVWQVTKNAWICAGAALWLIKLNLFGYATITSAGDYSSYALGSWWLEPLIGLGIWRALKDKKEAWLKFFLTAAIVFTAIRLSTLFNTQELPIYYSLRVRQFSSFVIGLVWPTIYMMVLGHVVLHRAWDRQRIFLGIVAGYGLIIHSFYIFHPLIGGYGFVIAPALLLCAAGYVQIIKRFSLPLRQTLSILFFIIAVFALLTSRLYTIYHMPLSKGGL